VGDYFNEQRTYRKRYEQQYRNVLDIQHRLTIFHRPEATNRLP
jgi:hypothetical protein|tara:strand:+ start:4322 stop:4450 length:129 start_codon:yes stop_codon:yes gene_type:complete